MNKKVIPSIYGKTGEAAIPPLTAKEFNKKMLGKDVVVLDTRY